MISRRCWTILFTFQTFLIFSWIPHSNRVSSYFSTVLLILRIYGDFNVIVHNLSTTWIRFMKRLAFKAVKVLKPKPVTLTDLGQKLYMPLYTQTLWSIGKPSLKCLFLVANRKVYFESFLLKIHEHHEYSGMVHGWTQI